MDEGVETWLESRKIIADFLREIDPGMTEEQYLHNGAAVLARLAQANILTNKVKESEE
jgi:hypothetical protein